MQELVGRLSALDPAASESLKIIAYFDTLIATRSGRLALLRAAAVLTGQVAGCRQPEDTEALRVSPTGHQLDSGTADGWPGRSLATGGHVWIERTESGHPIDAMVLERLALAVGLLTSQSPAGLAAVVVDAAASREERVDAAEQLRLIPSERVRAVAVPLADRGVGVGVSGFGPIATPWGSLALHLLRGESAWSGGTAGIGFLGGPDALPGSWASAVIALRARRDSSEVLAADDLGGIVAVVEAIDNGSTVPQDVVRLEQLRRDPGAADLLDAVADSASLRAAATRLGSHHSTVQARLETVGRALGFDPATPHGRTRLDLALTVARVRAARFD